jgi:ribonuclease Z
MPAAPIAAVWAMRSIYQAQLVNGAFGDPVLLIDFRFERRALLFDLGDVAALSTRQLLRVSDAFVSHAHMDHFAGFDRLLRVCLGRDSGIALYGPPGFVAQVGHKLAAYTWNVIERYETEFVVTAHEVSLDWRLSSARYSSRHRFACQPLGETQLVPGVLVDLPEFRIRAAFLDHGTPCLAFAFDEAFHINVWKPRLHALGLPTGSWLTELRRHVRAGSPDDTPIVIRWRDREGQRERIMTAGELKHEVLELTPGQRLCYVTDVAMTADNAARIAGLARDADLLYIEAAFLDADSGHAQRKSHLTARRAGEIAALAEVRKAIPFHFSTRYLGEGELLERDFESAWRRTAAVASPPSSLGSPAQPRAAAPVG